MKTPKEWLEEMKRRPCVTENDLLVFVKRIQDDAVKDARRYRLPDSIQEALNSGNGTYKP